MSGSEAERIRARQDKAARAEARRAKMERQAAREAAEQEVKAREQARLVAEARAAREAGLLAPAPASAPRGGDGGAGRGRDVVAIASRLEAREQRRVADEIATKARAKERKRLKDSGVGPKVEKEIRHVTSPYAPDERITVAVNLAEHPLEMMLARKRLTQPLYEAGVRYRGIFERAAIGPGRGIDPGKIKVDGGRFGDPLSDSVIHAQFELKRLARDLGLVGERIVSQVAGQGLTVSELAERWPGPEAVRAKMDYLTMRLREALDVLASEVWGAKGPERGTIVGERGLGSGDVDMQAVDAANQFHQRKRGISVG